MAASTSVAEDGAPCSVVVPLQIMTPGYNSEIKRSATEIPKSLSHFRTFVTTVTEHIAARLVRGNLCINSDESDYRHSLLQFVHWSLEMHYDFLVPVSLPIGGRSLDCWISSPWIDLVFERGAVSSIRAVVRWNERQFLVDQAMLAGARNMPLSMAMPLKPREFGYFIGEYYENTEHLREPTAKPIEEIVPPDILWLLRRSGERRGGSRLVPQEDRVYGFMHKATEKGAEEYTKLVLALIDRCFASDETKATNLPYYSNILDAVDLIPLEQYRSDMLSH
jgi:hypothetical protein